MTPAVPVDAKWSAVARDVYVDAVQPSARRIGTSLAKAVDVALVPLDGVVWGLAKIRNWVVEEVGRKLEGLPPEEIVAPNPMIAGPILEALKYVGGEPELREMYANLLARAMTRSKVETAHPAFA